MRITPTASPIVVVPAQGNRCGRRCHTHDASTSPAGGEGAGAVATRPSILESMFDPRLASLTTAQLADACLRTGVEVRCAPSALRPATAATRFAGPAQPVVHTGSVDVILEAISVMPAGAALVIDDNGRLDRACIGDLLALEAHLAGACAMVVDGLHRDTTELQDIAMPVFSLGAIPTGPLEWEPSPEDALVRCRLGPWTITTSDFVVGDLDGVIVIPTDRLEEVIAAAEVIRDRERHQADLARRGTTLREQLGFDDYRDRRRRDPGYTFRQHLRQRSASIEE